MTQMQCVWLWTYKYLVINPLPPTTLKAGTHSLLSQEDSRQSTPQRVRNYWKEEAIVRMKLLNFETGVTRAPRRRKVRDRERRLRVLLDTFKAGNVSIGDHLELVKHWTC